MKKLSICLILLAFASSIIAVANESEIIQCAQTDATEDGKSYHAFGVGVGACFLSLFLTPIVGLFIVPHTFSSQEAEVPALRITIIQDKYENADSIALYESEYKKNLAEIKRSKDGGAAILGAVVAAGIYVGVFVWLGSSFSMH